MATRLRENLAVEAAADACDAIAAALEGDPDTRDLAPVWEALTARGDALVAEGRGRARAVRRARARLYVADGRWDEESAAFGRATVDAAGGDRNAVAYKRFFGKVKPSSAATLGASREVELGKSWVEELRRAPEEALAVAFAPRIGAATDALDASVRSRAETLGALALHRTSVVLFIDDVNRELDRTEGALVARFPGQRARAASYLAITRGDPPRRGPEEGEVPDGEG